MMIVFPLFKNNRKYSNELSSANIQFKYNRKEYTTKQNGYPI